MSGVEIFAVAVAYFIGAISGSLATIFVIAVESRRASRSGG